MLHSYDFYVNEVRNPNFLCVIYLVQNYIAIPVYINNSNDVYSTHNTNFYDHHELHVSLKLTLTH